jgi:hypothetical protein
VFQSQTKDNIIMIIFTQYKKHRKLSEDNKQMIPMTWQKLKNITAIIFSLQQQLVLVVLQVGPALLLVPLVCLLLP